MPPSGGFCAEWNPGLSLEKRESGRGFDSLAVRNMKLVEDQPVELLPPSYQAAEGAVAVSETKSTLAIGKSRGEMAMSLKNGKAVEERIKRKSQTIVHDAMCAADIDDEGAKPEGWSDRRYRVAKDARKGAKERPYYLEMATKIREGFARLDAMRAEPMDLNANVINVYVDQRSYPSKEIKE
jgi:hypothetical protein